jgi:hypothetical protein
LSVRCKFRQVSCLVSSLYLCFLAWVYGIPKLSEWHLIVLAWFLYISCKEWRSIKYLCNIQRVYMNLLLSQ